MFNVLSGGDDVGEYLQIEGGQQLKGRVRLPAAKNSVLVLLAASLMCGGESYFTQVPQLSDVRQSVAILRALGCRCQRRGRGLAIQPGEMTRGTLPEGPAKAMRSSVFFLAPALHRFGRVQMPMPGGCRLGPRPIDIHLDGLCRMGAEVCWREGGIELTAPSGLSGTDFTLRLPSVGATETLMMAGALANGNTVLRNAAKEPEVVDLAAFLRRCGAKITGEGTPVIRILGVRYLQGAMFTPIPDRIVAATVACAVAAAGGEVEMVGGREGILGRTLEILQQAGCQVQTTQRGFSVCREGRLTAPGSLVTGGWPGFPTDAAPMVAAAMLTASGHTEIEDRVFENRFACAEGFAAMGARTKVEGRSIQIDGVLKLRGADVQAKDLRGGAALVTAALAAEGTSRIFGLEHIRRGYDKLPEMLTEMGAKTCIFRTE